MSMNKKDRFRSHRRKLRVRGNIANSTLPRVSVFRSLKQIYAQIIDDAHHATLTSCSSMELKNVSGDKKEVAHQVGLELARRAKEKGIAKAVFDRGSALFHGRVAQLAQGLRDGGLEL